MHKQRLDSHFRVLLTCLLILSMTEFSYAASFIGEVTEVKKDSKNVYKIFFQDTQYRMDMKERDKEYTVLVNRETGITSVLDPSRKVFREIESNSMNSLIQNPFESYLHMTKTYTVKKTGVEEMNGMICNKQIIEISGKNAVTAWVSPKYNFPIKMINHVNNSTVDINGLRSTPTLIPEYFIVPKDYTRVEEPTPKTVVSAPPEKKEAILSQTKAAAPIGRRVGPGGEMVIEFNPERHAKLVLKNDGREEATVTVNAYRGGIPVIVPSLKERMIYLKKVTGKKEIDFEEKQNPDTLAVKVNKGLVYVTADQESPMWEKEKVQEVFLTDKAELGFLTRPNQDIVCTVTGNSQDHDQSHFTVIFFKDQNKTAVLTGAISLKNGESKKWEFPSDKGILSGEVRMEEGGVQFSLYQPVQAKKPTAAETIPMQQPQAAETKHLQNPPAVVTPPEQQPVPVMDTPSESSSVAVESKIIPQAQVIDKARMILILDASGSMWGQLNGKAKIAIAKEVMSEIADEIPGNFDTGLMVYGHRRKGDCNDIEMLISPGPHNPVEMKKKIMAINPKGKTPLSAAVKQAAEALKYTEEKATVVLVSDGLETCDIDPCGLAAELAMTGVDFTVHVIGFDISEGDQNRLRCLADKTGGLFLSADNAGSLHDALFKAVEKIKEPLAPIVEDPGTATLSGPSTVPAGSAFSVKWQGPDSRGDYIAISTPGADGLRYKEYQYTKTGNPVELRAPGDIGTYELRYVHAHSQKIIGRTQIQVTEVEAGVQAPPSASVATEFEVAWQGPGYQSDYISIARPEQRSGNYINYTYTIDGNPLKLRSPSEPGTYEIRYIMDHDTRILAKTTIDITPVEAKVESPQAADAGSYFDVTWQGPDQKSDFISIARPDQRPGNYLHYTHTKNGNPLKLQAPSDAGTYEIRYILKQGTKVLAKTTIRIDPVTASLKAPGSAAAGSEIEVAWEGPGYKADFISIARPDQRAGSYLTYTHTRKGNPVILKMPKKAGNYEIRYIMALKTKILATVSITVTP